MTPQSKNGSGEASLYHYTTFAGLVGIVSTKSLWCSQIQYLNDSSELTHGLNLFCQVYSRIHGTKEPLVDLSDLAHSYRGINIFVCSFTESKDLLSQWRGYSSNSGVSIEVSFEKIKKRSLSSGFSLNKCIYEHAKKIEVIEDFIKKNQNHLGENLIRHFIPTAALFKDNSFSEENEWRLVSGPIADYPGHIPVRATDRGLIPYITFDLRTGQRPFLTRIQPWRTEEDICINSAIVGPHPYQELQMDAVGKVFSAHDVYKKGVGRSSIPFRSV